jgi:secreted trypsin-like serine protease
VWDDPAVSRGLRCGGARGSDERFILAAALGVALLVSAAGLAVAVPSDAAPDGKRVVGGQEANPAQWPYAAALMSGGRQFCGATVIAPDAVLTAAHCVGRGELRRTYVITGRPDLEDTSSGQRIRADHAFTPHGYRHDLENHDVAVVTLQEETSATPATLPTTEQDSAETELGDTLRVAGWGATKPRGGGASKILMTTPQYPVRPHKCRRAYRDYFGIHFHREAQICTRGDPLSGDASTTACYGDSGGPLIADVPAADLVVGVVSYGGTRCGVTKPTVYFRVASALEFIRKRADIP